MRSPIMTSSIMTEQPDEFPLLPPNLSWDMTKSRIYSRETSKKLDAFAAAVVVVIYVGYICFFGYLFVTNILIEEEGFSLDWLTKLFSGQ
ncbi:hypothetical protein DIPPA_14037 [Diplonema papillatum]|nr:hypothetical protein DIPPA_14037 [Diplonema papillatum]